MQWLVWTFLFVVKGHENVEGKLTRSELVNVQLPQKYKTELFIESHKKALSEGKNFTEDASLVFYCNPEIPIKIIKGKKLQYQGNDSYVYAHWWNYIWWNI